MLGLYTTKRARNVMKNVYDVFPLERFRACRLQCTGVQYFRINCRCEITNAYFVVRIIIFANVISRTFPREKCSRGLVLYRRVQNVGCPVPVTRLSMNYESAREKCRRVLAVETRRRFRGARPYAKIENVGIQIPRSTRSFITGLNNIVTGLNGGKRNFSRRRVDLPRETFARGVRVRRGRTVVYGSRGKALLISFPCFPRTIIICSFSDGLALRT